MLAASSASSAPSDAVGVIKFCYSSSRATPFPPCTCRPAASAWPAVRAAGCRAAGACSHRAGMPAPTARRARRRSSRSRHGRSQAPSRRSLTSTRQAAVLSKQQALGGRVQRANGRGALRTFDPAVRVCVGRVRPASLEARCPSRLHGLVEEPVDARSVHRVDDLLDAPAAAVGAGTRAGVAVAASERRVPCDHHRGE